MRVAAYARYSSDHQREASLEDQLRNCREFAARQGWPAPEPFTDAAISGSHAQRPSYRTLLARAHEFDIILVDDLSRLSRDSAEVTRIMREFKFARVRLIAIGDGLDTAREDAKLNAGLRGLMGELYVDDLAKKTHRGLTGRAIDGASAGGIAYGYRVTETGQRAIREDHAKVVRRIFDEYIAGRSPRKIVEDLNRDGIPSPKGGTWAASAVRADVFTPIFARYAPHLRLASVNMGRGDRLQPLKPEWDEPKAWVRARERMARKQAAYDAMAPAERPPHVACDWPKVCGGKAHCAVAECNHCTPRKAA